MAYVDSGVDVTVAYLSNAGESWQYLLNPTHSGEFCVRFFDMMFQCSWGDKKSTPAKIRLGFCSVNKFRPSNTVYMSTLINVCMSRQKFQCHMYTTWHKLTNIISSKLQRPYGHLMLINDTWATSFIVMIATDYFQPVSEDIATLSTWPRTILTPSDHVAPLHARSHAPRAHSLGPNFTRQSKIGPRSARKRWFERP